MNGKKVASVKTTLSSFLLRRMLWVHWVTYAYNSIPTFAIRIVTHPPTLILHRMHITYTTHFFSLVSLFLLSAGRLRVAYATGSHAGGGAAGRPAKTARARQLPRFARVRFAGPGPRADPACPPSRLLARPACPRSVPRSAWPRPGNRRAFLLQRKGPANRRALLLWHR